MISQSDTVWCQPAHSHQLFKQKSKSQQIDRLHAIIDRFSGEFAGFVCNDGGELMIFPIHLQSCVQTGISMVINWVAPFRHRLVLS